MEKIISNNEGHDELSEWSFPSVEVLAAEENSPEEISSEENQILEDQKNAAETAINQINLEVESIKSEFFRKIAIVNQILKQLEDPISILDKELTDIMQDIIKNAIKKIVLKEIQTDPKLMEKIIDEFSMMVQSQSGMINVFLSETDYNKISADYDQTNKVLKINPSLSEGDVVIKSNLNEIRAILDERINQVLGIKNG